MKKIYLLFIVLLVAFSSKSQNRTDLTITTTTVGATDFTSTFWSAFSDYFTCPAGKELYVEFVNHNSGTGKSWNNWVMAFTNSEGHSTNNNANYAEHFVLRADNWGWGNANYNAANLATDYNWDSFIANMNGATVSIKIDRTTSNILYFTAIAVATDGTTTLTETYNQAISDTENVVIFLVADGCYFTMTSAYLITPTSTTIGTPTEDNVVVISTDYYTISGVKATENYQGLKSGIYIKVETLSNGETKSTKIFKEK